MKGIDDATRIVARNAAAAAGLPIGSWIDRAVRRAAAPPADTPPAAGREQPVAALRIVHSEDSEDAREQPPAPAIPPAFGLAPEVPSELFPRSARHRGLGYGARVAIAVTIMTLLTGGALWLISEQTQSPSIASRTEQPGAQSQAAAKAPEPGTTRSDVTTQTVATPAAGAATPPALSEFESLRQAAQTGDSRAQYELGVRYASGREVAKDDAAAAHWFERAAVQGLASAQYNLGVMYDRGLGVKEDPTLAFFWYQSAAQQGHARAQHNLATAYADGRGTNADLAEAAKWFEKAAAAGVPESQYYLGVMYERGMGVPKDADHAMSLYRLAAGQGHKEAADKLTAQGGTVPAAATTAPAPAKEDAGVPRATLAEIQRLLTRLDFDPGPADGRMGKKTEQAIAKYQEMAGMPADGKPSAALLDDLREVAGAAKR